MTDTTTPAMAGAVEAALDAHTHRSDDYDWRTWPHAESLRLMMSRAIASADQARGRSYIDWRRIEDYEPGDGSDILARYAVTDPVNMEFTMSISRCSELPPEAIAWAEMPAPPDTLARTATDGNAPHASVPSGTTRETPDVAVLAGGESEAYRYLRRVFEHCAPQCQALPDMLGLCTQIDNLIAGYRIDLGLMPDPAAIPPARRPDATRISDLELRVIALEQRPVWSAGMADLLRLLAVAMPRNGWTANELSAFKLAINAAFPEPKL